MISIEGLMDKLGSYMESKVEVAKLELKREMAKVLAKVFYFGALIYILSFGLLFGMSALAVLINHWTRTSYVGFLVVMVLFIIALLVLVLASRTVAFMHAMERLTQKLVGLNPFEEAEIKEKQEQEKQEQKKQDAEQKEAQEENGATSRNESDYQP